MAAPPQVRRIDPLWVYSVLPAVVLNFVPILLFGAYFAYAAANPRLNLEAGVGWIGVLLFVFVAAVEWAFALTLLAQYRRAGVALRDLLNSQGQPLATPAALAMVVGVNLIFALYMGITWLMGDWPDYTGTPLWARLLLIAVVPPTAAFTEELIFRATLIPQMELRGRSAQAAVIVAALAFALIHGIILPLRVAATFFYGLAAGWYYVRERRLLPLIIAHALLDYWSFAVFLFVTF